MAITATQRPKFAVFGNPVKHSKSPMIHQAFAAQFGHQLEYRALSVELGDFERRASTFFSSGGAGLNVTVPFKEDAFRFADRLSQRARRAGAANFLQLDEDGTIHADNTDGLGLVHDMVANLGWSVQGARVLLLGAGGAARGVVEPLLQERPQALFIANRTAERALRVAEEFAELGPVCGGGYAGLAGRQFDLIINATSAGLQGAMPPLEASVMTHRSCCYDMVYGREPTAFMRWGASHAAWAVADGLGMLVEQAAESYYRWHRVRPETSSVIQSVRQTLRLAA